MVLLPKYMYVSIHTEEKNTDIGADDFLRKNGVNVTDFH